MLRCKSCSAPLRPNNANCEYCGVRNPLDLNTHQQVHTVQSETDRTCPDCAIPLKQLNLKLDEDLFIEQCSECFGLFFDHQELNLLLNQSVKKGVHVNLEQIENVNSDRHQSQQKVKYRRCPVCNEFMARRSYGYRSGVVVDRCPAHGEWLDNGELIHLIEWRQSGGQVLKQENDRKQAEKANHPVNKRRSGSSTSYPDYHVQHSDRPLNVLDSPISDILYGLFRVLFK